MRLYVITYENDCHCDILGIFKDKDKTFKIAKKLIKRETKVVSKIDDLYNTYPKLYIGQCLEGTIFGMNKMWVLEYIKNKINIIEL